MIWASYCISNGVAPLLVFAEEENSQYPTAFKIVIAASAVSGAVMIILKCYLMHVNKCRDRDHPVDQDEVFATALLDQTDRENLNFRCQMKGHRRLLVVFGISQVLQLQFIERI
jgi:hypothetical protein